MTYRIQAATDSSDSQSDDDVFWKKTPAPGKKRSAAVVSSDEDAMGTKKRSKNCVWLNAARDYELTDIFSQTRTYEIRDNSRGPENYLAFSDAEGEVDKADDSPHKQRGPIKNRMPPLRLEDAVPLDDIGVDFTSPPDLVKPVLVNLLSEPNSELLGHVVDALGVEKALRFYYLTESVEAAGGIYYADGSQRRTKGGVFLYLIRGSNQISEEEKKAAFRLPRQLKDRIKRKRRKLKKQLEKMLQPASNHDSDTKSSTEKSENSVPGEVKSENKEEQKQEVIKMEEVEEGELCSTDEESN